MPVDTSTGTMAELQERWRRQITASQQERKRHHGTWATNLAFAAGQHYMAWDKKQNKLRSLVEMDPASYGGRDLYQADRITEYRQAQLGELKTEDDRPQLLAAQHGEDAEQITSMLNQLESYAWEHEWQADAAIQRARELAYDLGHCAVRCRWNPNEGPVVDHVPMMNGRPIQDQQALAHLEQHGMLPDGSLPKYKPVQQGRTMWQVYSAFQTLTPPGVVHEDDFRWEALMLPVPIEEIKAIFGKEVRESTDIANAIGMPAAISSQAGDFENRLRDHAWFYICFDRPSQDAPNGRTLYIAGSSLEIMDVQEGLPYLLDERPHTGVVYMHWWRLSDRFCSRGAIETLKDPQRIIDRRKTQNVELIDRAMPKVITRKGEWPDTTGRPHEIVELSANAQAPTVFQGPGPGQWMYQDIASLDDDMNHASTLSILRLGENPSNVQTYGQLAILNDNEHGKRAVVVDQHRDTIATLVKLSMSDLIKYWPDEKQATVLGEEDRLERVVFQKSQIPSDFRVKVAKGQTQPRTQGAQIKMVDAILAAMVESGYAGQHPDEVVSWYKRSLEAGSPQELPRQSPSTQQQLAHLENLQMRDGEYVEPTYYDSLQDHLPIHREEEDKARAAGDVALAQRLESHLIAHLRMQQQAPQMLQAAVGPPPGPPGMPPAGPSQGPGGFNGPPAFAAADLQKIAAGG